MRRHWQHETGTRRGGFTLIELLVVMSIMAVLAALVAAAVFRTMGVQALKNTQTLILKLEHALRNRWSEVVDAASNEPLPPQLLNQGLDPETARARYIQARLMQEFPENISQAMNPGGFAGISLPPIPAYQSVQGLRQDAQSSALLYLALQRSSSFNSDSVSARELRQMNGVQYIVDGWDMPLSFSNGLQSASPQGGPPRMVIRSGGPDMMLGTPDDVSNENTKLGD